MSNFMEESGLSIGITKPMMFLFEEDSSLQSKPTNPLLSANQWTNSERKRKKTRATK